jgi:hypothetical protein
MIDRYRLAITLRGEDGQLLVDEEASCDSLAGVFVELGNPRGYTGQRFLDRIDTVFLRGATAPKIVVQTDEETS